MANFTYNRRPSIHKSRSRQPMDFKHITAFNVGELIPNYIQDILPGDTFKVEAFNVLRNSSPFIKPPMDNLFFEQFFFFVPWRIIFDKTKEFFGENTSGYWTSPDDIDLPSCTGQVSEGTLADYFGITPNIDFSDDSHYKKINILPFRAYAEIYNEWFRDQNVQDPVYIYKGIDDSILPKFNNDDFGPDNFLGKPAKVNKFHDYFTSCLPEPQKGDSVFLKFGDNSLTNKLVNEDGQEDALFTSSGTDSLLQNSRHGDVFVDLSGVNLFNINDLRVANSLQRKLERDAIFGTRYTEYCYGAFGTQNPDYTLQRPELLSYSLQPLNIQQVASTSAGEELASLGAYSLTNGKSRFNKGFTEHGYVIGLCCIRYKHTYSQGLERLFTTLSKDEVYDPAFAHIGEQPVFKYELDANVSTEGTDDLEKIFGYNEAWAHLRFKPNRVSGVMRPGSLSGLAMYHFADDYSSVPSLNSKFLMEYEGNVDRTLSVPSFKLPQFIADFYFKATAVRVLPVYSKPALEGKI